MNRLSTSQARRPFAPLLRVARLVTLSCGCLLAAIAAADEAGGRAALPDVVRTKHRTFQIPFRPPRPQDADAESAPTRIMLDVSRDLGVTWQVAGETAPATGSLAYTADTDGEYWFRLRAIDRKGRTRGGAGPDMRVLVDAAGPRLAARVWKGSDGEIICRYAAADDSLRLESMTLEYRGAADPAWKTVAIQPVLSRESPAHAVGEEIWWAGEKVESLAVKIVISDSSGNVTTRQFKLEPTDPQVDQATLAKEIGVPPLPEASAPLVASASPASGEQATDPLAAGTGTQPSGWPAETGSTWPGDQPAGGGSSGRGRSVLVRRPDTNAAFLPRSEADLATRFSAAPHRQPAAAEVPTASPGQPLTYQGKPLHIARARRFAWDYEVPAPSTAGRLRAELWCTRDGGVTWQRAAVDDDGRSPIEVQLSAAGLYGVRLEMVADAPDAGSGPRSGDAPEAWLGVDEEPPQVEMLGVTRDEASAGADAGLVIRYSARDPLLAPRSTRILYSPHAEGPWATVAEGLENKGEYRWRPDRGVPARVHIRVEVADAAGNVGAASTPEAISVASPRFIGKLGGLRAAPGQNP
jgi:hypothetical protein